MSERIVPDLQRLTLTQLEDLAADIGALLAAGQALEPFGHEPVFSILPGAPMRMTIDTTMPVAAGLTFALPANIPERLPPPDTGRATAPLIPPSETAARADIPQGGSAAPAAAEGDAGSPPAAAAPLPDLPELRPDLRSAPETDPLSRPVAGTVGVPTPDQGGATPPPSSTSALAATPDRFANAWTEADDTTLVECAAVSMQHGATKKTGAARAAALTGRSESACRQRMLKLNDRILATLDSFTATSPSAPPTVPPADEQPAPAAAAPAAAGEEAAPLHPGAGRDPSLPPPEPVRDEPAPAVAPPPAAAGDVAPPPADLVLHLLNLPHPSPWTLETDENLIVWAINGWTAADIASEIGVTNGEVHARLARLTRLDPQTHARRFSRADVAMALSAINRPAAAE